MRLQVLSLRSLSLFAVVSAVLLAGGVACDFPLTIDITGPDNAGVGDDASDVDDPNVDDDANVDEADDDAVEDSADDAIEDEDDDDADDVDAGDDDDGEGADTGSLAGEAGSGRGLFATNCAVCHADDATGVVGPNIQGEKFDRILDHAVDGHEGHTMFDLTDLEVADIEAFLATLVE